MNYGVISSGNVPTEIATLMASFSLMMLKKGYQLRVADTELGHIAMTAAVNEGEFYSLDTPPWMLSTDTNTESVNATANEVFHGKRFACSPVVRAAVSLVLGVKKPEKSGVVIIWSETFPSPLMKVVIALCAKYKISVVDLGKSSHVDQVIKKVEAFNKKSAVSNLISSRRRH